MSSEGTPENWVLTLFSLMNTCSNNSNIWRISIWRIQVKGVAETGRNILILLQRSHVFITSTSPVSTLITQTLLASSSKSSQHFFCLLGFFSPVFFVCHVLEMSSISSLPGNPPDNLLYSHMGSLRQFLLESWQEKLWRMSAATDSDICVLTYSPSR